MLRAKTILLGVILFEPRVRIVILHISTHNSLKLFQCGSQLEVRESKITQRWVIELG